MTERAAQESGVGIFVQRALEELFSGSTDAWDRVLDRALGNRRPWLRRVRNFSVSERVPLKPKSEAA